MASAPKLAYETPASAAAAAAVEAPTAQGMEAPPPGRSVRYYDAARYAAGVAPRELGGCYMGAPPCCCVCVGVDPGCVRGTCGQHDCGDDCAFFPFAFLGLPLPVYSCLICACERGEYGGGTWMVRNDGRKACEVVATAPGELGCYMAPMRCDCDCNPSIDESATPACACRKKC